MNCVFFGHREAPDFLKEKLKAVIFELAGNETRFYVGNSGAFDALVQGALAEMEKEDSKIKYSIALSRIDELALSGKQENTIFPEGQETAVPIFAISKRNEWLFKKADIMVVYLKNKISNTYKYVSRAEKRGIKIINLAEKE